MSTAKRVPHPRKPSMRKPSVGVPTKKPLPAPAPAPELNDDSGKLPPVLEVDPAAPTEPSPEQLQNHIG